MTSKAAPAAPDPRTREGTAVAQMFSAIAPTYDLLNHLLSFNVDRRWRRAAVEALEPLEDGTYLDLCTGTGDLALEILRRSGARVVGADFSMPMLGRARSKGAKAGRSLELVQADAMSLPLASGFFDGVTVAFGARNFQDLGQGLAEMARVLKPGGRALILEFSTPQSRLFGALYRFYFHRVLPWIGRIVSGGGGAYRYLPASVQAFPPPGELAGRMRSCGLTMLGQRGLTGGIATLHLAVKSSGDGIGAPRPTGYP